MSLWSRIRGWFGSESAQTRPTGGVPDADASDTHSTTGTTPSDTWVGMASGDDPGEVESPAERRTDDPPRPEGESPASDTVSDDAGRPSEETRRAQGDDAASGGS